MKPSDSLGGQNSGRSPAGARSSRARATLWDKLRNLDRQIGKIERIISWRTYLGIYDATHTKRLQLRLDKLDARRRETRHKLKAPLIQAP